jgi:hypothetical protein
MARPTWQGVKPCEHTHLHRPNSPLCADCWQLSQGWDVIEARYLEPFERGDKEDVDDYAREAAYANRA